MGKVLGFTGTRSGLTESQKATLRTWLEKYSPWEVDEFVHGGCVGADADAHRIAKSLGMWTHVYPCDIVDMQAELPDADETAKPMAPLLRDRLIAGVCDILFVCPKELVEIIRSGTWATMRYARKAGHDVVIIWSHGRPEKIAPNERRPWML